MIPGLVPHVHPPHPNPKPIGRIRCEGCGGTWPCHLTQFLYGGRCVICRGRILWDAEYPKAVTP